MANYVIINTESEHFCWAHQRLLADCDHQEPIKYGSAEWPCGFARGYVGAIVDPDGNVLASLTPGQIDRACRRALGLD